MADIFVKFNDEINEYLDAKLPDIQVDKKLEISAYLSSKVSTLVLDALYERDREWREQLKGRPTYKDVQKKIDEYKEELKSKAAFDTYWNKKENTND